MLVLFFILNSSTPALKLKAERCSLKPDSFVFEIKWEKPTSKNITKGFYKVGEAPTSNDDTSGSLTGLPDTIYVPQGDGKLIFVWLADEEGENNYQDNDGVELKNHLINVHLINKLRNKDRYLKVKLLGLGKASCFTAIDTSFHSSGIETFGIEAGIDKGFAALSARFDALGSATDISSGDFGFGFLKGEINISRKQKLVSNFLGAEPSIGWCWVQEGCNIGRENDSTGKHEEVFSETHKDDGLSAGINLVNYVIPNLGNCIGVRAKYSHFFCMKGINEFGVELMFYYKGLLCTFGINGYEGKDLNNKRFDITYLEWFNLTIDF